MPSTAVNHPELPFDSELVTVVLSDEQKAQLLPLVRQQVVDRRGLLFCSVAPFLDVQDGETKLRLQAAFIDHKTAGKILKLISDAKNGAKHHS
jgi:hypothetical protein